MNLLSLKKIEGEQKLTLDKINKKIRSEAKSNNFNLSIIQSHDEAKVVSYIQKNRNKLNYIIMAPGPWAECGFVLRDLLSIINVPFSIILSDNNETIFDSILDKSHINVSPNYIDGYIKSIKSISIK